MDLICVLILISHNHSIIDILLTYIATQKSI